MNTITISTNVSKPNSFSCFNMNSKEGYDAYIQLSIDFKNKIKEILAGNVKSKENTFEVTVEVGDRTYKLISDKFLPNAEHMLHLAELSDEDLMVMDTYYSDYQTIPTLREFEDCITMTISTLGNVGTLDDNYVAIVDLKDFYTETHIKCIEKLIRILCNDSTIIKHPIEHQIEIISSNRDTRELLMDLSVSDYCDITFKE